MHNYWKPGDWNAYCDTCGFKFKASMLRKRWDGMYVCSKDWETRHPQDFLRSRRESLQIPWARNTDRGVVDVVLPRLYVDWYYVEDINGGVYVA